jgi:drug/metabolite transporter (DMT)-like permease
MSKKSDFKLMIPYLALMLVQLLFGLNYPASKLILNYFPPILWSAIRMGLAALLMFATAFWIVPKQNRKVDGPFLMKTFYYGFFGMVLCQTFFMIGLKNTTSTNGAVLNTLIPIFTLLVAIVLGKENLTVNRAFGFLVAVVGVLVLRNIEDFETSGATMMGDLFMILNCLSLAIFFTISRDFLKNQSAYWVTAWMFLFGSIVIFVTSLITGLITRQDLELVWNVPWESTLGGAVIYNVIGATLLTYFLNSWTLKRVSASSVAVFIYLQPVIAVLFAWIFQNEPPTTRTILSIIFIFSGVMIGVVQRPMKKVSWRGDENS